MSTLRSYSLIVACLVAALWASRAAGEDWTSLDIGTTTAGSTTAVGDDGLDIVGSGADIWGTADGFRFVYRVVTGNFEIRARVASVTNTDPWAKAGVAVRASTDAGSMQAIMVATSGNGFSVQWRPETNGNMSFVNAGSTSYPNAWVRLVRKDGVVTAYKSNDPDGLVFEQAGDPLALNLPDEVCVGLCVTAHSDGALCTGEFRNVSLGVPPTPSAVGTGTGLWGTYFNSRDFTDPALARVDATVNFDWSTGSPAAAVRSDDFTIRWLGQVEPRFTETYRLYTRTDDGVRLWVNNQLLVDKWQDQGGTEWFGSIALEAGQKYDIKLEYYDHGGGASAQLSWSSLHTLKEIIPQTQLYVAGNADTTGPSVAVTAPENGGVLDQFAPVISVTFNEPMDHAAAEAAFQIAPGASGSFAWSGNTMTFTGGAALEPATAYTVTITTDAKDIAGNAMAAAHSFSFTTGLAPGSGDGLWGTYFNTRDFTQPGLARVDPTVNFVWGRAAPDAGMVSDNFTVRLVGQVQPRFSGICTFHVTPDDGARLWVNGELLVDAWYDQGPTEHSGSIALEAGQKYEIKLEHYEHEGDASISLAWSSPLFAKQVIPQSQLYSAGYPDVTPPTVVETSPAAGGYIDPVAPQFSITFSEPMNHAATESAITINGISGTCTWSGNTVTFVPADTLAGSTTYIVTVGTGACDIASNPIAAAYTFDLVTGASPGSGTGLAATYFNTRDLIVPALTRVDATVDFNWGDGSPDPAVNPDSFSARWLGQVEARYDEQYTFYVRSDDGARLWVDGQLLVDAWWDQGPTEHGGTITLQAGQKFDIRLEYYEHTGGTSATLSWSSATTPKQVIPQSQLYPTGGGMFVGDGTGLQASYYPNEDLFGAASVTRVDGEVNFDWGGGSPDPAIEPDYFSARWIGMVQAHYSGPTTFYVRADDGVRLWVNNQLLADAWKLQAPTEYSATLDLVAGQKVPIRIEYFEHTGGATMVLSWSGSLLPKSIIPRSQLYPVSSMSATLPTASVTSPVCIEGKFNAPDAQSAGITVTGPGGSIPVTLLGETAFYADVPLDKDAPASVTVAQESTGSVVTGEIVWTPTNLTETTSSENTLLIRKGDSLLLSAGTAPEPGVEPVPVLNIDPGNGGEVLSGVPGDKFAAAYNTPGTFVATASIDGAEVGSLTVVVVAADLHVPIAAVLNYQRELDVYVQEPAETPVVTFCAGEPERLSVSLKEHIPTGATLYLKPLILANTPLVARLNGTSGPIIASEPLQVFKMESLNNGLMAFTLDRDNFGTGRLRFKITPRTVIANDKPETPEVEGLFFYLTVRGSGIFFSENGQTTLRVPSTREDEDGIIEAEIQLSPNGTLSCHDIKAAQVNSNEQVIGEGVLNNPPIVSAKGGLYLLRELSDEISRTSEQLTPKQQPGQPPPTPVPAEENLYPPDDPQADKQKFGVWDADRSLDGRWTDQIKVYDYSPESLEAAFFGGDKMVDGTSPNRWFTVKISEPRPLYNPWAVRFEPSKKSPPQGGKTLDDNAGENRDEIVYNDPGKLKWDGTPKTYPAVNQAPNFHRWDYDSEKMQHFSWDMPEFGYVTEPTYTDFGFYKGNMFGNMDVWVALWPAPGSRILEVVEPLQRPSGDFSHQDKDETFATWDGGLQAVFPDLVHVGRLEVDGYTAVVEPDGYVSQEDRSSRDRFPDMVGANVYKVQEETDDAQNPGQTKPVVYIRTFHEGTTGTANPVPVQVTFRAAPGETVRVAVSLATKHRTDGSKDGLKTHKAWLSLSDKDIFEYRGQPEDSDSQKAQKVFKVTGFEQAKDKDGNPLTDDEGNPVPDNSKPIVEPAKRVVFFEMTAAGGFGSQVVYVYGIEPTLERIDELKFVVWGEEYVNWKAEGLGSQGHHNHNEQLAKDQAPGGGMGETIYRWWITDDEPVNVGKVTALVDSNNNGTVDDDDDLGKDDPAKPGKLIPVNSEDVDEDGDGVPDFADGFSLFDEPNYTKNDTTSEYSTFVVMKLTLTNNVDPEKPRIRFKYDASDPSETTRDGSEDDGYTYTPGEGALRIWRKDAIEERSKDSVDDDGDYFAPDGVCDWSNLDPWSAESSNDREKKVYLEGIKPGQTRVIVEVDPDGDGPLGFVLKDILRVDVFEVTMEILTLDEDGVVRNAHQSLTSEPPIPSVDLRVPYTEMLSDGRISMTVTGHVSDSLSELVDNQSEAVSEIVLKANNRVIDSVPVAYMPGREPWTKRTLDFSFERQLTLDVLKGEDVITVAAEATNGAGRTGSCVWSVPIEYHPVEDIAPLLAKTYQDQSTRLGLQFVPGDAGSMSISVTLLDSVGGAALALPTANPLVWSGPLAGGDPTGSLEIELLAPPAFDPNQPDKLFGTVRLMSGEGIVAEARSVWCELGNNSQIFEPMMTAAAVVFAVNNAEHRAEIAVDTGVGTTTSLGTIDEASDMIGGYRGVVALDAALQKGQFVALTQLGANCIAASESGLWSFSPTGCRRLALTGVPAACAIRSLAATSDGRILVLDGVGARVLNCDGNGNLLDSHGQSGSGAGELSSPTAIALDSTGKLYILDTGNGRVQIWGTDLNYISEWSIDGLSATASGLAVDNAGCVYVCDTGNNRVLKFSAEHALAATWDNGLSQPSGIAADGSGNLVVADKLNHRLVVFSTEGEVASTYGGYGNAPGLFRGPFALCLAAGGDLNVVDTEWCLHVFDASGQFLRYRTPIGFAMSVLAPRDQILPDTTTADAKLSFDVDGTQMYLDGLWVKRTDGFFALVQVETNSITTKYIAGVPHRAALGAASMSFGSPRSNLRPYILRYRFKGMRVDDDERGPFKIRVNDEEVDTKPLDLPELEPVD